MICPVRLANEMSGLSGMVNSVMTGCGHEVDERSRSGAGVGCVPLVGARDHISRLLGLFFSR